MSSKNNKPLKAAIALILLVSASAFAELLPYRSPMPRVPTVWGDATPYDTVLKRTWEGIKKRNIAPYPAKMLHRPKSEYPGDAVSEGIGYGMFLALYSNDKAGFDSLWDAGERYMWNSGGYYDWHRNSQGGSTGVSAYPNGPASDADQDIALLLIFADQLVKKGVWQSFESMRKVNYGQRARSMLPSIMANMTVTNGSNRYLLPGSWGGINHLNPGYFAPAFYRVFAEFDSVNAASWNALVEGSYQVISNSPGYGKGLLPDWCGWDGKFTQSSAGYNGYRGGIYQYRDAIRVYWRLATDYLWYGEPKAKAFLDNAIKFLGSPDKANFFDMNGNLPPVTDGEMLNGGTQPRTRREHSHLTLGMWAAAAMGSGGPALAQSYSDLLLNKFYAPGRDFFGQINIPEVTLDSLIIVKDSDLSTKHYNVKFAEDTLRNEMYFDQFLAWFGASMLAGVFTNVWEDLKDGVPQGPPEWRVKPVPLLANWNIDAAVQPFRLGASFKRSVNWTVTLRHDSIPGQTVMFRGKSDTVNVVWYGLSETGSYMPHGFYTLTINAPGLEDPYETKVWLGRPYASNPNLREGNRLLVDDFADGDLYPYIGRVWTYYSDATRDGGSTVPTLSVTDRTGGGKQLDMSYTINRGNAPYGFVALEWNCRTSSGDTLDLRGVDSIIFVARSRTATLGVSVQLVGNNFAADEWQYFEDSVYLTATPQTFRLRLASGSSNFKQRLGGSGKDFNVTLSKMNAIRFQVQDDNNSASVRTNAIIFEKMYFAGPDNVLSRLYTYSPPPAYIAPPHVPEIISVVHRARAPDGYSIKRSGSMVRITTPPRMAGASVSLVNVKGRVVKRLKVPQSGKMEVSARDLAAGMYFVEIRKKGAAGGIVRLQLGNVK